MTTFKRARWTRSVAKLVRLGERYRRGYPKKMRSQTLWVAFLRKHGPEFLSKKGA
jgi:hypothetical protein